jgi:uncharacterized membrane protein
MIVEKSGERHFLPATSAEVSNVIAHFYRGEMSRMISWRDRIDRTTNWAITMVAAMLSLSLSTPTAHHGVLIFAMLLTFLLLNIESRRYRFFDVYRTRVRLIERSYYACVFAGREPTLSEDWMKQLANSLSKPAFVISLPQAMSRRLRRNYGWIFVILLIAWIIKNTTAVLQPGTAWLVHSRDKLVSNAAIGAIPGWLVLVGVAGLYSWLLYLLLKYRKPKGELAYGDVHV